jgi:uncharacterized protein (DUF2225 family)
MTRVGKTTLTCPNCHHDFETHALYSSHSFGQTTEFRALSMGEPPEPYFVHTCPTCGLSGWDDVFDDGVSAETSALIAERLTPLMGGGEIPAWHRFVYAAQVAEWQHEPDETIGFHYLCAAWCYGDQADATDRRADNYRRHAIACYGRALAGDRLVGNERAHVTYMMGELHRRIGDTARADSWFGQVAGLVEPGEDGQRLAALASRQRTEPADTV